MSSDLKRGFKGMMSRYRDSELSDLVPLFIVLLFSLVWLFSLGSDQETVEKRELRNTAFLLESTLPYAGEKEVFVIVDPEEFFRGEFEKDRGKGLLKRKEFIQERMKDLEGLCIIYHLEDASMRRDFEKRFGKVDIVLVDASGEMIGMQYEEAALHMYRVKSFFQKKIAQAEAIP